MISETFSLFRERLGEVIDLSSALALLQWDQEVYMPPKAGPARGLQLATLSALQHRLFTSDEMGRLLTKLQSSANQLTPDEAKMASETWYDYQRARCLPEAFVQRFAEEQSKAYLAWVKAREASDFSVFRPHLETLVDLLRQRADYLGFTGSPYNALLEDHERGMTVEQLKPIFDELAPRQKELVARIAASPQKDTFDWLEQTWNEQTQWEISLGVLRDMGYDFEAGRQDKSVHPFTTNFDLYDVRVTTRIHPGELFSCLTGSIHEGGHALYEQGFQEKDQRSALAQAPSLGMHESQSRLWENMIGRSRAFWEHYAPVLRAGYAGQLDGIAAEDFYRAMNIVRPSLIRVEADECTYNLHIILRFEIELALIEGRMKTAEVPEAWNAKMKDYLGIDVPDDARGCLQDIHWSHGSMGYFPTYTLGNLYAAQLFERVLVDIPGLWEQVAQGDFKPLLAWLRHNVHQHGRRMTAAEVVQQATGAPPSSAPFLRYLENKFGAIYGV